MISILVVGLQMTSVLTRHSLTNTRIYSGVAFDGSIDELPMGGHPRLQFSKKFLGNDDTLKLYMQPYSNICMKIDIEGGEIDTFAALDKADLKKIAQLDKADLKKIAQLVIEFHTATEVTLPSRLNKTHVLVHYHANNWGGIDERGLPNVFECTYLRKDIARRYSMYTGDLPILGIDQPNRGDAPDIMVTYTALRSII
jgi:hypothetical protein